MSDGWMAGDNAATRSDEEVFISRLTASQSDLTAFILSLVPHQVDADDLLQEVNLALWRKRHLYNPNETFLRWAFGFAAMEVRSFRSRSSKSRLWYSEATIDALTSEWVDGASFMDDCNDALAGCIQKLGGFERRVLQERFGGRASFKQIAESTGRPVSTVHSVFQRAIESLRACVKRSLAISHS